MVSVEDVETDGAGMRMRKGASAIVTPYGGSREAIVSFGEEEVKFRPVPRITPNLFRLPHFRPAGHCVYNSQEQTV